MPRGLAYKPSWLDVEVLLDSKDHRPDGVDGRRAMRRCCLHLHDDSRRWDIGQLIDFNAAPVKRLDEASSEGAGMRAFPFGNLIRLSSLAERTRSAPMLRIS